MSLEQARQFMEDLCALDQDRVALQALSEAAKEPARQLYSRAEALLGQVAPKPKIVNTFIFKNGGRTPLEQIILVREIVLPYPDYPCDLVLANAHGQNIYYVNDFVASLYLRERGLGGSNYFGPGAPLFTLSLFGYLHGSVTDREIVSGFLDMFEAQATQQ